MSRKHLRRIKVDTVVGMGFANLVALCIVVATAVTLNQRGIVNIQTSAQAAEALRPVAGDFAFLVFALGIIGTGLLAVPVLAGSAAYAVSELFGWKAGLVTRLPRGARLLPDHHRRHRHRLGDGRPSTSTRSRRWS